MTLAVLSSALYGQMSDPLARPTVLGNLRCLELPQINRHRSESLGGCTYILHPSPACSFNIDLKLAFEAVSIWVSFTS